MAANATSWSRSASAAATAAPSIFGMGTIVSARLSYGQARALLDQHTAFAGPGTGVGPARVPAQCIDAPGPQPGCEPAAADGQVAAPQGRQPARLLPPER